MKNINDICVIVQARLGSQRVPGKMLRPFANTTLVDILFEKLNDTVLSDISSKLYSIYFKNVGKLLISQPELINSSFNFLASKTESLLSP